MEYGHSFDKATVIARQALERMVRHKVVPNPDNFAVWYLYACGENPELRQVIDLLITSDQEFSPERSAQVFKRFCSSPFESVPLSIIAERVEAELGTALATLDQANRKAVAYGDTLEAASGKVGSIRRTEDLTHLLGVILSQTRAMAKQSRDVERQLRQSCAEVGQLKEQLDDARREAMTDALTAIANRKMFDFMLREAAIESVESGEPLCLLFLDIDHFKQFNDNFGHAVGDQVLKLLAAVLKETCKGQDTPARYGGEEFAVILPRTGIDNAARLAENIRERIASKPIVNRKTGEQLGRVQVSIGAAEFAWGEPVRSLVERADKALYQAKNTGRNRVVVSRSEPGARKALAAG
jgi:diguanylate cyclase